MKKTHILFAAMLASLNLSAQAGSPQSYERYKPDTSVCQETYSYHDFDKIVAESKSHAVVRQDAGTSCAAGAFFLVNKRAKTYRAIDSGTCDDRGFSVQLTNNQLIFKQNKRITSLYPIYGD